MRTEGNDPTGGTMASRSFLRKVLTDPKLRAALAEDPAKVLGSDLSKSEILEVKRILTQVRDLEGQIAAMGTTILCQGDSSPRGIA